MEQPAKKRPFISPRIGTILGIIVIALAVFGVLRSGPHEVEHDSLFAPPPATNGRRHKSCVQHRPASKI